VLTPIAAATDSATGFPMHYNIGMALRRQDRALRDSLQKLLVTKGPEIQAILKEYSVPLFPMPASGDSMRAANR
jgi:hypothetical protein